MKEDIHEVEDTMSSVHSVMQPLQQEIVGDDPPESPDELAIEKAAVNKTLTRWSRSTYNTSDLDANRIQEKYKNKMKSRCKRQLARGVLRCRMAFKTAIAKCNAKFPIIVRHLLCWPFRASFICKMNLLGDPEMVCDPSEAVPDNFGETYVDLKLTENELHNNETVEVTYKVQNNISPEALK